MPGPYGRQRLATRMSTYRARQKDFGSRNDLSFYSNAKTQGAQFCSQPSAGILRHRDLPEELTPRREVASCLTENHQGNGARQLSERVYRQKVTSRCVEPKPKFAGATVRAYSSLAEDLLQNGIQYDRLSV